MHCQKCLGDTAALDRRGWRGEGGAEEPFDVLPDHIGFEVHLIADALEGKGRLGPSVGMMDTAKSASVRRATVRLMP